MGKKITIDGQEFELTPAWGGDKNKEYHLKPIKPVEPEEKRREMHINISYCDGELYENGRIDHFTDTSLSLDFPKLTVTEAEAKAVAASIEALLEYIQSQVDGGKTTSQKHNVFIELTKKAGKAHKIAGKPKVPRSTRLQGGR